MLKRLKGWGVGCMRFVRDWLVDLHADIKTGSIWLKLVLLAVGVYLLVAVFVGGYWSSESDIFSVRDNADTLVARKSSVKNAAVADRRVTGVVTTAALIRVIDILLEKPGGLLSNDVTPPGMWLDNIPNWEKGVLIQARDLSKAMREAFSRSQSQSTEDPDLAKAESRFIIEQDIWVMPMPEDEYREGGQFLEKYLRRIVDADQHNAQFFARADNLNYWLRTVETRLGSLSQRLTASVGQRRVNIDLVGESGARQSTVAPTELVEKTPWLQIDDVFYEARGTAWALMHFLKAVEVDFDGVLRKKNALVSLRQIIRELEATQETVYSPMILNGSGFGFLANHSLVMASYISRANAAIIDLRELLAQG